MFEQPIVRVWMESGRAERVVRRRHRELFADAQPRRRDAGVSNASSRERWATSFVTDVASGRATKLTDVNPELRELALGDLKPIKWRSFDGMEIWGLLLTPPNYAAGRRVPLLVYCHGGPNGGVTYGLFPQFMHVVSQVDLLPGRGDGQRAASRFCFRCRAAAPDMARPDSDRSSTRGARATTKTS